MLLAFPPKYFSPLHSLPITRLSENTFFYILLLNAEYKKRLKFGHGTERVIYLFTIFLVVYWPDNFVPKRCGGNPLLFSKKEGSCDTFLYSMTFFVLNKKRGFLQYNTCDTFLLSYKILKTHLKQHMYFWVIFQKKS